MYVLMAKDVCVCETTKYVPGNIGDRHKRVGDKAGKRRVCLSQSPNFSRNDLEAEPSAVSSKYTLLFSSRPPAY